MPSRRLGRSLGVDLVPFKACTLDCRFCQLGQTPVTAIERKEYVPTAAVLAELERWMAENGGADHVTLSGSGEPTLHTGFGEVLRWVGTHTPIKSALLTNGSLLHLPEVRAAAALADKVKATLSAWDEESFRRIHRPAPGITFEKLVAGEQAFRRVFAGELSLEVFVLDGINSDVESIRRIAAIAETIAPDRIDLNTAVRPPADLDVKAVAPDRLAELAAMFGPKASVAARSRPGAGSKTVVNEALLLGVVRRHPATAGQLAREFGASDDAVRGLLDRLATAGLLRTELRDGERYFVPRERTTSSPKLPGAAARDP